MSISPKNIRIRGNEVRVQPLPAKASIETYEKDTNWHSFNNLSKTKPYQGLKYILNNLDQQILTNLNENEYPNILVIKLLIDLMNKYIEQRDAQLIVQINYLKDQLVTRIHIAYDKFANYSQENDFLNQIANCSKFTEVRKQIINSKSFKLKPAKSGSHQLKGHLTEEVRGIYEVETEGFINFQLNNKEKGSHPKHYQLQQIKKIAQEINDKRNSRNEILNKTITDIQKLSEYRITIDIIQNTNELLQFINAVEQLVKLLGKQSSVVLQELSLLRMRIKAMGQTEEISITTPLEVQAENTLLPVLEEEYLIMDLNLIREYFLSFPAELAVDDCTQLTLQLLTCLESLYDIAVPGYINLLKEYGFKYPASAPIIYYFLRKSQFDGKNELIIELMINSSLKGELLSISILENLAIRLGANFSNQEGISSKVTNYAQWLKENEKQNKIFSGIIGVNYYFGILGFKKDMKLGVLFMLSALFNNDNQEKSNPKVFFIKNILVPLVLNYFIQMPCNTGLKSLLIINESKKNDVETKGIRFSLGEIINMYSVLRTIGINSSRSKFDPSQLYALGSQLVKNQKLAPGVYNELLLNYLEYYYEFLKEGTPLLDSKSKNKLKAKSIFKISYNLAIGYYNIQKVGVTIELLTELANDLEFASKDIPLKVNGLKHAVFFNLAALLFNKGWIQKDIKLLKQSIHYLSLLPIDHEVEALFNYIINQVKLTNANNQFNLLKQKLNEQIIGLNLTKKEIKKYIKDHDKYKHATIEDKFCKMKPGRLKGASTEEREQWLRVILIIEDVVIIRECIAKLMANDSFFKELVNTELKDLAKLVAKYS